MRSLFGVIHTFFGGHDSMPTLSAGVCAPDFALPTAEGHQISLHETLKKGPVVLAFFKVSCPVCQYAFPFFERMYQANRGTNVSFIGISQDNTKKTEAFLNQFGITFPVVFDDPKNYTVSNAYGLANVPTLFYISQSGQIEIASVSWAKAEVEAINEKLAANRREPAPTLWHTGEDVREFRAG